MSKITKLTPKSDYSVGENVYHKEYGVGIIAKIDTGAKKEDETYTIWIPRLRMKTITPQKQARITIMPVSDFAANYQKAIDIITGETPPRPPNIDNRISKIRSEIVTLDILVLASIICELNFKVKNQKIPYSHRLEMIDKVANRLLDALSVFLQKEPGEIASWLNAELLSQGKPTIKFRIL